tara:strand:- start:20266 stop:20976 length:711 start_codon:yes stop_codon:yes gene_type:complete
MNKNKIIANSIWISDTHLGSGGSQTHKLEIFLQSISCNNLFLNGDIIDKYLIKNITEIKIKYKNIINLIKNLQENGTKIYFLQGNHDKEDDVKKIFPDIIFKKQLKYQTKTNKTYLIFHGDQCDKSVALKSKSVAKLGTKTYEFCLSFKKKSSKKHFSQFIKIWSKKTLSLIFKYEKTLLKYLNKEKVDGVICGHSHQPIIKKINNKDYLNTGDWIDNCSYILETDDGEFKLHKWQ